MIALIHIINLWRILLQFRMTINFTSACLITLEAEVDLWYQWDKLLFNLIWYQELNSWKINVALNSRFCIFLRLNFSRKNFVFFIDYFSFFNRFIIFRLQTYLVILNKYFKDIILYIHRSNSLLPITYVSDNLILIYMFYNNPLLRIEQKKIFPFVILVTFKIFIKLTF